jgi:hypothetical protein
MEAVVSPKMCVPYQTTHLIRKPPPYCCHQNLGSRQISSMCISLFVFLFGPNVLSGVLFENSSMIKKSFLKIFCRHFASNFVSEKSPKLNEKCRLDDTHSVQVPPLLHPGRCLQFARPLTTRRQSQF